MSFKLLEQVNWICVAEFLREKRRTFFKFKKIEFLDWKLWDQVSDEKEYKHNLDVIITALGVIRQLLNFKGMSEDFSLQVFAGTFARIEILRRSKLKSLQIEIRIINPWVLYCFRSDMYHVSCDRESEIYRRNVCHRRKFPSLWQVGECLPLRRPTRNLF